MITILDDERRECSTAHAARFSKLGAGESHARRDIVERFSAFGDDL